MKYIAIFLFLAPIIVFAETITYHCNYTAYSDQEGNHKTKNKFEITFIVDKVTGKAYMQGNIGISEIMFVSSDDQLAFLEISDSGNVMSTAIDSKLNTVHSRNSVILGELIPSQHYGKCDVK